MPHALASSRRCIRRHRPGVACAFAGLKPRHRPPSTANAQTTTGLARPEAYGAWLADHSLSPAERSSILSPYPAEEMEAYPVSTGVNTPRAQGPNLKRKVEPDPPSTGRQQMLF